MGRGQAVKKCADKLVTRDPGLPKRGDTDKGKKKKKKKKWQTGGVQITNSVVANDPMAQGRNTNRRTTGGKCAPENPASQKSP